MKEIWVTERVEEVADWCDINTEYSYFTLLYGGEVLSFYPKDDGEEVLFRLKWGGLIR